MKKLKRQVRSVVGLDIGTHSVKLVHLVHGVSGRKLLSRQVEEFFTPEAVDDIGQVTQAIREVFRRSGLKPGRGPKVITSVGGSATAIKHVEFPLLTDEELDSSVHWQAQKYLPFEAEDAVLEYQVLGKDKKEKNMSVLLAAVTNNHLKKHYQLLDQVGLEPMVIDLDPLAVINAFLSTQELVEDKSIMVLDLGASKTTINMFSRGSLFFTREVAVSGRRLTAELQSKLKIPYQEAEKVKCEGGTDHKLLQLLKEPLNQLLFEIRRSLTFYENRTGGKAFHKLYLAGGGSRLVGFAEHLHAGLGVPVEEFDPLKDVKIEPDEKKEEIATPQLALAFGLALRGVGG